MRQNGFPMNKATMHCKKNKHRVRQNGCQLINGAEVKTVSPYEIISADAVVPGELILLTIDEQTTTAFAFQDASEDVGFLLLEGNHIDEVEYLERRKVQ